MFTGTFFLCIIFIIFLFVDVLVWKLVLEVFKLIGRKYKDEIVFYFCWDHKKHFCLSLLVVLLATLIVPRYTVEDANGKSTNVTRSYVYSMFLCEKESVAMKAETHFDWFTEVCRYETKTGLWLPIHTIRNTPEADNHSIDLQDN